MIEETIRARAQQAIKEKVFPGCVIGMIADGSTSIIPVGTLTDEGNEKVEENTIYDVASITKSIPVASLALLFAQFYPARLNLAGKVVKYLPELRNDHGATIEDLLRYRVKGPQMSQLSFKTLEEIRTYVFEHGFDAQAGDGAYTNLPAFLLGLIVERVGEASLPVLANRYFFEPLGMSDTTFFPVNPNTSNPTDRQSLMRADNRIAPTKIMDGEEIRGIVHDESARVFALQSRAVGHAGLFSPAPVFLTFLEALLVGKLPAVVAGAEQGLGWSIDEPWRRGRYSSKMFSKTGFTGCLVAADAEKGIGLVILSNRTHPRRPPDNSAINIFRKDIADIVFG